jgi:hypothetical protein
MLSYLSDNWGYVLFVCAIIMAILLCGVAASVLCGFFIMKWLNVNMSSLNGIYFYDYSPPCKKLLLELGEIPISKVYLIRKPITHMFLNIVNAVTLNNLSSELDKCRAYLSDADNPNGLLYHTSIIFELRMPNGSLKTVWLDKNNRVNLMESYLMDRDATVICAGKIRDKTRTIRSVLEETRARIGSRRFFNWHVYKNNCQCLTKEVLITLKKYTRHNKEFVYQHKLFDKLCLSDFTHHIFNSGINVYNVIEHAKLSLMELI